MPDKQVYRSETRAVGAGGTIAFPTAFLDPARKMVAPEIQSLDIHVTGHVTVVGAAFKRGVLFTLFDKVQIADPAGDRVNLRGSSMRQVNQVEYGAGFDQACNNGTVDVAVGAAQAFEFFLRTPLHPLRCRRRADFRIPLQEFLDGGLINLYVKNSLLLASQAAGADTITVVDANVEIIATVVEARNRELKSRVCWLDYDINQQEFSYPVGGSLRYALAYVGDQGDLVSDNVSWDLTGNVTSRTLDLSNIPVTHFTHAHSMDSSLPLDNRVDANGDAVDGVVDSRTIPIAMTDQDQKTPQLPDMATLHVKFSQPVPAGNPKMIICSITDRSPTLSQRTFRAPSQKALSDIFNTRTYVKTAQGTMKSDAVKNWGDYLPRRLPLKAM